MSNLTRLVLSPALFSLVMLSWGCGPASTGTAQPVPAKETSERTSKSAPPPIDPGRAGKIEPATNYVASLNEILGQAITADGLVRYDLLRESLNDPFRRVLKAIEGFDGELQSDREKLAFWINAYNVQMLQSIIENPDVGNIVNDDKVEAFFQTPFLTAGRMITLDEIEHVILRRTRPEHDAFALAVAELDPRIHVGLNCAAISCPKLAASAFTAGSVDGQLDLAMRQFADSDQHFRAKAGSFMISSLIDWFATDWEAAGPAGDFILSYMSESRSNYSDFAELLGGATVQALRDNPNVAFDYDWDVNAAGAAD